MKNSRKAKVALFIFFIGLIIFMVFHTINVKERGKKEFRQFYSSELDGVIVSMHASVGGVYFKLNNTNKEYNFVPLIGEENKNSTFYHTAEKGDRIVKPAYADTLTLITEDTVYKYTFEKFE